MTDSSWQRTFSDSFNRAVEKYRAGHQKAADLVDAEGVKFLASIGYTEQEFFDFVEDFAKGGEPTLETALAIAAVRREYFLEEQKGRATPQRVSVENLPSKDATVEGIGWLPATENSSASIMSIPPNFCCGSGRQRATTRPSSRGSKLRRRNEKNGNHVKCALINSNSLLVSAHLHCLIALISVVSAGNDAFSRRNSVRIAGARSFLRPRAAGYHLDRQCSGRVGRYEQLDE
jgi:hypothetical protein